MKTVLRVISMIVLTLGIIVLGYIMCVRLFGVDNASRLFEVTMQESEGPSSADTAAEEEEAEETDPLHWTISFVGDCTLASSQYNNDFINKVNGDYNYPFKNVADILKADDYTIANLECTFSDRVGLVSDGTFAFKAPSDYARILPAGGIDFVTTANNHRDDFADNGRVDTDMALDIAGVPHRGDNETYLFNMDGHKIGIYCCYNHLSPTEEMVKTAIDQMKEQGASFVICAFHWGVEGSYQLTEVQDHIAHYAVEQGADVVFGSHPHVLQKIEKYKDSVILYSMGNFSFGGNTSPRDRDTAIVQVVLTEGEGTDLVASDVQIIPCCLSSTDGVNDYCPKPYAKGTAEYDRVLSKLNGTFEGPDLTVDYSNIG